MEIERETFFKLTYCFDEIETQLFLLSENFDDHEFIFQIICISGYKTGTIIGYIKRSNKTTNSLSYEEFVKEISRNFLNPKIETLKIYQNLEDLL